MKEIEGNLLDLAEAGEFDYIIHCCNCFNTMGSGIAKAIKTRYPRVYAADCNTVKGYKGKLGTFTYARVYEYDFLVVNLYGQYNYGSSGVYVDYDALRKGLTILYNMLTELNKLHIRIGTYRLGGASAGGDWEIVKQIIAETLPNLDVTIVTMV